MRNIKVSSVVYELLLEMAKKKKFRSVEQYLDAYSRGESK